MNFDKKIINLAIKNLEITSKVLEKAANNPKIYNTDYAYYLEQISYATYCQANKLKQEEHRFNEEYHSAISMESLGLWYRDFM